MRLLIVDRSGGLDRCQRDVLERRLLFNLTRFAPQIERVRLAFDEPPSTTGFPLRCRGAVTMLDGRRVQVDDWDDDCCRCGCRVADRLGRSISRLVDPRNSPRGISPGMGTWRSG